MLGSVWTKTLRDYRRSLVWWSLGIVGFVALYAAIWPTIDDLPDVSAFLDAYPEALKAFFGGEIDLGSPEGYLQAEAFSFLLPLVFLVFGIGAGGGTVAGEEDSGTLELVLATPVPRHRIVLEKLLALTLALVLLGAVLFVALWAGAAAVAMEISAWNLASGAIALFLFALLFTSLALLVGAATGSRGLAIGVAATLAVLSYVVSSLALIVELLERLTVVSPFHYYAHSEPLRNGLDAGHALVLLAVAAAFAVLAPVAFGRRDARL